MPQELKDWLALIRAPALGPARLRQLVQRYGSASAARQAPQPQLRELGLDNATISALRHPDEAALETDLAWLNGAHPSDPARGLLTCLDDDWPPRLKEIDSAPAALFYVGRSECLWLPQLAVVGSRSPTSGGLRHARAFAAAVARTGLVVTSGLALGVDGAAHAAALDVGGMTVAVAATGLDQVYPARHRDLAGRIVQQGVMVSELPPGTGPRRAHFPQRNRIISGLAMAVLVVEASVQSGSLITARLAAEQGRDVFALPGSIDNPLARGCHRLIKNGAKLVEDVDDLVSELAPAVARQARQGQLDLAASESPKAVEAAAADPNIGLDDDYQTLLQAVGYDPVTVDGLVSATGLTADAVSSMLLILELRGLVQANPGGRYCRAGEECE